MKKLIWAAAALLGLVSFINADSFGGSNGGTTTTVAAPYITVAGVKYVAGSMFPFTAFPACSSLDAQTATLTANTNGSETVSYTSTGATNFWCSVAATTSVEAEFRGLGTTNSSALNQIGGIWICDTTNSKLYSLDVNANTTSGQNAFLIEFISWTLASCAGTPSVPTGISTGQLLSGGPQHLKLVKVGGNLQALVSTSGGDGYNQIGANQGVGTLSKAGVVIRTGAAQTTVVTFLSTPIV